MFDSWFNSSAVTVPEVHRAPEAQAEVDRATAALALYHYGSCVFCARVRKAMAALALEIELRDVMREPGHHQDLRRYGGSGTVPCLRIGKDGDPAAARWLYESADIIAYLVERFGTAT